MTRIILTPEQQAVWQRGWWDAYAVETDLLEDVDRQRLQEPVVVLLADGVTVAFGLTPPRQHGGRR